MRATVRRICASVMHASRRATARGPNRNSRGPSTADCRPPTRISGSPPVSAGAERALAAARQREPGNPVVTANLGVLQGAKGDLPGAIRSLEAALAADPTLDEARFNLALAYARAGRRSDAGAAARELLSRLPPDAPQRSEVQRLLRAVQ